MAAVFVRLWIWTLIRGVDVQVLVQDTLQVRLLMVILEVKVLPLQGLEEVLHKVLLKVADSLLAQEAESGVDGQLEKVAHVEVGESACGNVGLERVEYDLIAALLYVHLVQHHKLFEVVVSALNDMKQDFFGVEFLLQYCLFNVHFALEMELGDLKWFVMLINVGGDGPKPGVDCYQLFHALFFLA